MQVFRQRLQHLRPTASLRRFWYDAGLFGATSLAAGVANYFFSVLLAHGLGPRRFGALATLLNLVSLLLLPVPIAQLVYTRIGQRVGARLEPLLLWGCGLLIWLLAVALAPALETAFAIPTLAVITFASAVIPAFAYAANVGILQRARNYARVGLLNAGTAFLNLLALLLALGLGVTLTGFGLLLALVSWATWYASKVLSRPLQREDLPPPPATWAGTVLAGTLYTLFSLTDGLLARHLLAPTDAGRYIGLSMVGGSLLFFSGVFGTVLLTAVLGEERTARPLLLRAVLLYLATAALGEGLFLAVPGFVVELVLGPSFLPVAPLLPRYGGAMVAEGVLNVLLYFVVGVGAWPILAVPTAGYALWLFLLFRSRSIAGFTAVTLWSLLATCLATAGLLALWQLVKRPAPPG